MSTITVSDELKNALETAAQEEGVDLSTYLRRLLVKENVATPQSNQSRLLSEEEVRARRDRLHAFVDRLLAEPPTPGSRADDESFGEALVEDMRR